MIQSAKYAYRDRKNKKREFRALWIGRLNAALREMDVTYSVFMNRLRKANIIVNRKMLSEMAIHRPEEFKRLVDDVMKR